MKDYFTTHDIAGMLNVTRVTVGNWIDRGRMKASRTPGGHRRISRKELVRFLEDNYYPTRLISDYEQIRIKNFIYCWEFHQKNPAALGERHRCSECLVYRARAQRCYILQAKTGQEKVFCSDTCKQCSYYKIYFDWK